MARIVTGEISWKPRRSRKAEAAALFEKQQPWLPFAPQEIFAGDEGHVVPVTSELTFSGKKTKPATLPWSPRGEGRED